MGLAVGTAKFLVFFFNFIFFVTGIGIIIIGALAKNATGEIEKHLDTSIGSVPIFLIVVGVFVAGISFFGCCGAMRNSYCMLMTFAILLGIIFIMELAAGIAAYVNRDKIVDEVHKGFDKLIEDYYKPEYNDSRADVDALQQFYQCCGSNNVTDWFTKPKPEHKDPIPGSCCDENKYGKDNCTLERAFKEGCFDAFTHNIEKNVGFYGAAGIGIAFIQILGIVLACCLASAVKNQV